MSGVQPDKQRERRNKRVGIVMGGVALGMVGMGFASVPLYRLFCQVTGLNGTVSRAEASELDFSQAVKGQTIQVRFDANHRDDLPWDFKPEQTTDTATVGARDLAIFIAKNKSNRPVTGTATYNVTPAQAGKYFTKIQCFCFTQQTLQPGEQVRMPVIFYIDPKIATDPDTQSVEEITLSYTFYPVDPDKQGG